MSLVQPLYRDGEYRFPLLVFSAGEGDFSHCTYGVFDPLEVLSTAFFRFETDVVQSFLHLNEDGVRDLLFIQEVDQLNDVPLQVRHVEPADLLRLVPQVL